MRRGQVTGIVLAAGLVLLLGLWHLTDVRAGVVASGDRWLYGYYIWLLLFGMVFLAMSGYQMCAGRQWSLERFFVWAALGLGIMFCIVLPPLSAPDEASHYISSYELSNRLLGREACTEDSQVYIRPQDCLIEDMTDILKDDGSGYREGRGDEGTVILGQELTEETYRWIYRERLEEDRENTWQTEEGAAALQAEQCLSYQPTVRTTPMAYVPQAVGITISRLLGLGPVGLLFFGRLMNLFFFTAMGYLAIRRMPFGKEILFGVYMLPMTLHLASSFSYDVMILACSGYFAAICLDLAYRAERVRAADVLLLALLMGVMGPCKMVYGVITGYCLLIPIKKFGGIRNWVISAVLVLGAFCGAMIAVNRNTVAMYAEASESYVAWAQETGYTFSQLIHSPLLVIKMCYNTLMWQGEQLYSGMIGSALGNMDPVLNTPYVVVLALTAILAVLALKKPGENVWMGALSRAWIWFLSLTCLSALMFSMLLAWTPVTASMIQGVQGRYLLPLLPMILLTVKNDRVVRTGWNDGYLLYVMTALDVYVILRIFAVVCLRVS